MTPTTLRDLAKELCEIKEGSQEMDWKVAEALGRKKILPDELTPVSYTTSLDAKLPGEDIIAMSGIVQEDGSVRYQARQRERAWPLWSAHTEPLARRAAALLAMAEQKEREG